MRSVTFKLIAAFVLVAALSVVVLAILINQATTTEFDTYLQHMGKGRAIMGSRGIGGMISAVGAAEEEFLGNMRRFLWWTGIVAVAVALAMGIFLARQIVLPLRRLATATRAVAAGDLKQRVQESSRDEVGEVARAFNFMAESLARDEELRRNMAADIAHELRTPLTVLQGQVEGMIDGVVEPTPARLASLHDEITHLSRLVSDLRTLSLAEAGQLEFHLAPTDVAGVVQQIMSSATTEAAQKKIFVSTEVEECLPMALADADRLSQVLRNLLDNALRYTPEGGQIKVSVSQTPDKQLLLAVSDTGPGIPEKDLPYIFERFYRADASRSQATGGSGIGLAIVKQFVEAMGGKVRATSQPGKGSMFYFTLPQSSPQP